MAYLSAYYSTGSTVVAVIRDSSLQFADVENEVMEDYDDGDITDYDTACTEVGSTGEYYFTWPDWLSAGQYTVQFLPLAGATIAESDMLNRFSVSSWYWDGTNLMPDWAAKIAGVASPVSDSIEDRVKDALADTSELQGNQSNWTTSTLTADQIKTALEADGSKLDHLWETTEDDGEGTRKFTSDAISDVSVDTSGLATSAEIAALETHGDATWATGEGGVAGSGAVSTTVVCQVGGSPVDGVEVWVTTDAAGTNVVAGTITTDSSGEVDFMLDAGDYYVWRKKAGINFSNPQDLTVS